jgi:hypothetical protein
MMAFLMFVFLLAFVAAYAVITAHDDDGRHDE